MTTKDTRFKNALIKYEIAELTEEVTVESYESANWLRLGKWIPTINNESEDVIQEEGYYDGDGTTRELVDGNKERYTIEGTFDPKDPAQALIASKKHETGDARVVLFKKTYPDKSFEVGPATIANIKVDGGLATDLAPFSCTISRNSKPTITPVG